MNYATSTGRPNPTALLGALGVPAAFGAILVAGLAVKTVIPDVLDNPDTIFIPEQIPEDPPVETEATTEQAPTAQPEVPTYAPPTIPTEFDFDPGASDPITRFPDFGAETIGPVDFGGPGGGIEPTPTLVDPIAATPLGDPGNWVRNSDYRSNWIRKGLSGTARFALTIDVSGKVSDCTITQSSGHNALDSATCSLLTDRATFDPARDSAGNPIVGSYRSSINWTIP